MLHHCTRCGCSPRSRLLSTTSLCRPQRPGPNTAPWTPNRDGPLSPSLGAARKLQGSSTRSHPGPRAQRRARVAGCWGPLQRHRCIDPFAPVPAGGALSPAVRFAHSHRQRPTVEMADAAAGTRPRGQCVDGACGRANLRYVQGSVAPSRPCFPIPSLTHPLPCLPARSLTCR